MGPCCDGSLGEWVLVGELASCNSVLQVQERLEVKLKVTRAH